MKHVQDRRARFFEFFWERLKTAQNEDVPASDRMILLSVLLDSLAKHWMSTSVCLGKVPPVERMRRFLCRAGQHEAWGRVSVPLLRDSLESLEALTDIQTRFPFDSYERDGIPPVATWKNDPAFDDLAATGVVDRRLLGACSYPGIVYKELRCGWLHESRPGRARVDTPAQDHAAEGAPRYRHDYVTRELTLIIPMTFLAEAAETALRSFEVEATERDIVPYAERAR